MFVLDGGNLRYIGRADDVLKGKRRDAGSVHGLLFITFIIALYRVIVTRNWPLRRALRGFLYSLTPFGVFVFDRSLVRDIATQQAASSSAEFVERTALEEPLTHRPQHAGFHTISNRIEDAENE